MAQERLTMRKVREILRLYYDRELSQRAVARSCRVSHSTVKEYVERAQAAGLSWPLPEELSEAALYASLYPEKTRVEPGEKAQPDWKYIKQELGKKHVTLKLLWVEYREQHPDGYGYSQFCELYKVWKEKLDPPMRQTHKAGEKAFVDYTGDTVPITNPETGEISQAEIFVATLGYSNYTYSEAQASQSKEHWIGGHVRAFAFWGGVPDVLVPDNLKAGVKNPCYYDPELNPNYQELAEHYSTVVLPSRVRKPRDKAKVEVGVQVVERWILARLRNRTFFSLVELNRSIRALLDELNSRPMQHLEQSRRELFETMEQSAMQPLPDKPYEFVRHKIARVNVDYHVDFEKHYYSVPHELIHEEVRVRASERLVEIYHKSQVEPVAIHPRSHAPGRYSTRKEHMPLNHQKRLEWSPERFVHWANNIGPQTTDYVQAVLVSRRHPEQAYRTCLGLLNLAKSHPVERFETACQQAMDAKLFSYRELKEILIHLPAIATPAAQPPNHPNLRGSEYYQ